MVLRSTIKSISSHLFIPLLLFGMGLIFSGNSLEAKPDEEKDYATKTELEVAIANLQSQIDAVHQKYEVGDLGPAGGIVFFVTDHGIRGLEFDQFDTLVITAQWGCYDTAIVGADGTVIGTGAQNTRDIVNGCPDPDIAARLADQATINGYDDWFLPSIEELEEIQSYKYSPRRVTTYPAYWSSTEIDETTAYIASGRDGWTRRARSKSSYSNMGVRLIRAF